MRRNEWKKRAESLATRTDFSSADENVNLLPSFHPISLPTLFSSILSVCQSWCLHLKLCPAVLSVRLFAWVCVYPYITEENMSWSIPLCIVWGNSCVFYVFSWPWKPSRTSPRIKWEHPCLLTTHTLALFHAHICARVQTQGSREYTNAW